jgi:type VI secretion system protein VasJ
MPDADETPPLSTPLLDAVRAPIPGGSPAGIDMAYEDAYLGLKAEVDAMGAATGSVDFETIVGSAAQILTDRSKDISVACYLAFGLIRTKGYAGLAEGVGAVRAVAEGFWEGAYPPLRRMRARQSAMQFMAERLNAWVESQRATPDDREALEQALAEASALQDFTTEAMGDEAPALSGLTRTIREALRQLPAPPPPEPPPPDPDAVPSEPESSSDAGTAPAPAGAVSADIASVDDAQEAVLRAAGFLREQDPYDATARLLVRAVRWGDFTQAPPAEGGRTLIPAPPEHTREAFAALLAANNLDLLAQEGEDLFPEPPFYIWLDLQRLLATALQALGPPAAAARSAVVDATAAFVRRLPTLPTLAFDDGTPFADALTVAWLDEITAGGEGGGGGAPSGGSAADGAIREARTRAGAGDVPGAVAALVAGAGAPRDRFERGVAAAEMCLGAGRADVALALLDDADEAVRAHRLDVWDPAAARTALRLLHAACTALLATAGTPDRYAALAVRADDAFARMARLDPGLAMRTAPLTPEE